MGENRLEAAAQSKEPATEGLLQEIVE